MSLAPVELRGCDDSLAFLDADGHWLFEQQMDSGFERPDGEVDVVEVGCGEVDGVDGSGGEQLVELIVGVEGSDAVFFADLLRLFFVTGDERDDLAVAGVFDAGKKCGLRDPADADHGVADLSSLKR